VVTGEFSAGGFFSKIIRSYPGTALLRSAPPLLEIIQKSGIAGYFTGIAGIGITERAVKQQMVDDFHAMNAAASIETLISLSQHNMTQFLGEIQQPTRIVIGSKDITVPPEEGQTAAREMPNATLTILEGAYHHPHEEQPEAFAAVIRDFLEK
jgi:pimeloyl-ACP methyl ester carboxylesterase